MLNILLLLLLNSTAFCQTSTDQQAPAQGISTNATLTNMQLNLNSLLSGRPTVTGQYNFQSGLACSNTSGNCITFQNGTTMNTAPSVSTQVSPYQVAYSSGSPGSNVVTFVLQSSTTYTVEFYNALSSGTSVGGAYDNTFACTINADTTAGHYYSTFFYYPGGLAQSNAGAAAYLIFDECGALAASDGGRWTLTFGTMMGYPGALQYTGTGVRTCQTRASSQSGYLAGTYYGTPPYTITCSPVTGDGWQYSLDVYQVP